MPGRPRRDPAKLLQAALEAQGDLVAEALAAAAPDAPTRRPGCSASDLDRHLGAAVQRLADSLSPRPPGPEDEGGGANGPRLVDALPRLRAALDDAGRAAGGDAVVRTLVELVASGRDLPQPVPPDRAALGAAVRALAQALAERAPGRHVEARVPPYAAVQCVEGPRHTRGTPPNVVEADPVAFVELCTGRLSWADAVADGRVRTWGDRADLSPWLPLQA